MWILQSVLLLMLPKVMAWYCIDIQSKDIVNGVLWKTQNCTKDGSDAPLLVVNSIHVDMTSTSVRVVPAIANPTMQVQSIPDMGSENDKFIAGINGGIIIIF